MNFRTLIEATTYFSDLQNCKNYIIQARWKGKIECPFCKCDKIYNLKNLRQPYKCSKCAKPFSIIKGTIFEKSQIPLQKWLVAIYIISSHKKGISSVQLALDIGVTQKSAWFMAHRIRESLKCTKHNLLKGIVEIDETYMGRKFRSEYKGLSPEVVEEMNFEPKPSKRSKGAVLGIKERDGKVIIKAVERMSAQIIEEVVSKHVASKTMLMTDEAMMYRKILKNYVRQSINHSSKEWVRGDVHTNGIENFWSVMKRGIYGIYHQISYKHLQRYCDEFTFRFNARNASNKMKFDDAIKNINRRLTYKELIRK